MPSDISVRKAWPILHFLCNKNGWRNDEIKVMPYHMIYNMQKYDLYHQMRHLTPNHILDKNKNLYYYDLHLV